jgi:hypothetical protein
MTDNQPTGAAPVLDMPTLVVSADQSSTRAQRTFLILTACALLLVTIGAIMGAIARPWPGWIGAATFALAFVSGALAVTQALERTWYDGRALAESGKSLTWLYAMRAGAFVTSDEAIHARFTERLRALRDELRTLDFAVPAVGPEITPAMTSMRESPLEMRRACYEQQRLSDQITYYRGRAVNHTRQAARFRAATWAAQTLGFTGAILKATSISDVDLLGIGAACAASFTAWLQTRDHVTLARAYELTAQDLDAVLRDGPPGNDEPAWAQYVADAEAAMSREHVMWIARRGRLQSLPASLTRPNGLRA